MDNSFSTKESQVVRRQSSLGGNNITRKVTELEGNTALVWAKVTQVYYQKGTCDFTLLGGNTLLNNNSGSDGTYSAPIPVDYYGTNYAGKPFIKTRLVKEGNKVLVAFVDGKLASPVIVGVYPDDTEGYEYLAPAYSNKILSETEDTNSQVNNQIEVEPSNQIIYQSGNGNFAKSMQGKSFLLVQGGTQYALDDLLTSYETIPYFYVDEDDNDSPAGTKIPLYSVNNDAPEWLLVHESNNGDDTHRTRFYVNQKGELQIVFFDINNPSELLVIDGNKDTGFTVNKRFDGNGNLDSKSTDYVKFNVGDNHSITMSVASEAESKAQAQTLELKKDGLYLNGKSLQSYLDEVDKNQGSVNPDDVKDIINSTTGVKDWDNFKNKVDKAAQDAKKASDDAKKAGDDADRAGEDAAQAGLNAKLAGENASQRVDNLRDKLLYYLNLSPEQDTYVPGKYIVLNEDVTIKNGFIKEGYIDDAVINSANIKDAAINSAKIKDLAVYDAKIANAAITNAKIANLAVGTAKIRDLAVTDEKVGRLSFVHMIGQTLDANLINVTNLNADSIKAHSISADKLFIGSLGEISGNLGNITSGNIDAGNVNINNLPADDPDILTPEKKAKLRATIDTLREAVKAQNDFQNSVGAPSDTCDNLNNSFNKLLLDTNPLLRDMNSNTPYDHNLIQDDINNVNSELDNLSHRAITTIGKTADGKNTIYTGAFAPKNPKIGDIWAKPSSDGSNEGTFEIYGENGWFSPTKDVFDKTQSEIAKLKKSYYQTDQPSGDIVEGSMWYKPSYDAQGYVDYTMYVYHNGAWVKMSDDALKGINEKINQIAQTADGKNSIYSSATAPANPKDNDIWIDTGHNNAIKVYIGGKWISPNANQEHVNQQINNAFKDIPSVYYQSTQPSGNIVEGSTWYKTGDNNTYTMYTYKNGKWVGLLDDNINTAVDNSMSSLQKAGSNLIINSDFSQGTYGWSLDKDTTISSDSFKGHKYVTINKQGISGTPFYWISQNNRIPVTPGESVSFSAWIKHTGVNPNGSAINLNWYTDTTSSRKSWFSKSFNSTSDTDWEFYKCENIIVPDGIHYTQFSFTLPANGNVSYALPMLVHGATVPNWGPSSLDSASVSDINSTNNSINTLRGNVDTINNQLEQQQNQLKGLSTINYVPNSGFVTDTQNGLAQTSQHPYLWRDYSNEWATIAGWSGQPLFINNYINWGTQTVNLTKDYNDCITRGWVDKATGTTKLSSGNANALINRLLTVVPGDTITISNDNVDRQATYCNFIAWYDKDKKFITTTMVNGLSKTSSSTQSFTVPYGIYYAKIGFPYGTLQTKNTPTVMYTCKNMVNESVISDNPGVSLNSWKNVNQGSGKVTNVSLDSKSTPGKNNSGLQVVNTWTNYQNTGVKATINSLVSGEVYTLSLYARANNGGGSLRLVTNNQSYIQIIPNTGNNWIPMTFNFIPDCNNTITLYFDAPNTTTQITGLKISNVDSNSDPMNIPLNKDNWNNYIYSDSKSLTDDILFGSNVISLAPNNQVGYNYGFVEGKAYKVKMWAKTESGTCTLHVDQWGGFNQKNVNVNSDTWTYVEMPIIYSGKTDSSAFLRDGSKRSVWIKNASDNSNIKVAGFDVYDYESDINIDGYIDSKYSMFEIDASSAVYGATSDRDAYVRIWRNGKPAFYPTNNRGTTVTVIDTKSNLVSQKAFDTYESNNCDDLVKYLNGLANNSVVVLTTSDANTLDSGLQKWLEGHGVAPNLIQTYNQQRVRMCFIGTTNGSYKIIQPKFGLESTFTKYQQNTFPGSLYARCVHFNSNDSKNYCLHTYPIAPKSWTTYSMKDAGYMDWSICTLFKNNSAIDDNIVWNSQNSTVQSSTIYSNDYQAFGYTAGWNQFGIYNMPYDLAPKLTTDTIPIVTSTHESRIQASSYINYSNMVNVQLEVADNKRLDNSTLVQLSGPNSNLWKLQNYFIDGIGEDGWNKYARLVYTLPVQGTPFRGDKSLGVTYNNFNSTNSCAVLSKPMLTVTQEDINYVPQYVANNSGFVQNAVQLNQAYNGVKIDDKNGITITSGNNQITLNANVGIDIWGNSQHNMSLDTDGNLIMRGNLVAGNISGVYIGGVTFKGDNMNLDNVLNVNGAIKSNGVTIDSGGLHVTNGDITLGDTKGNTYTQITSKGSLIAKSAVISGTVTSNNVNITGGSINLVKPDGNLAFHVDSKGNATFSGDLSGVDIKGNNSTLSGMLAVNGTLSAASGNVIMNNSGLTINRGSINIGNGNGTTFTVKQDGTLLANNATITGDLTARKLTIASDADVSINVNGQFKVEKDGSVFARRIRIQDGSLMGSTITGGELDAVTLRLSDSYNNLFYGDTLSQAQYDSYGYRTGYSVKGCKLESLGTYTEPNGVGRNQATYIAVYLNSAGFIDENDGSDNHYTNCDVHTDYIMLRSPNAPLHLKLEGSILNGIFNHGGARSIIFYDSNKNYISGKKTDNVNDVTVYPPPGAMYYRVSLYVGDNNAGTWLNAIKAGNFTSVTDHGDYRSICLENSAIVWQGNAPTPGYDMVSWDYGEVVEAQGSSLPTDHSDSLFALQMDASHLSTGDYLIIRMQINYDSPYYQPGTVVCLSMDNALSDINTDIENNNKYFEGNNKKYLTVGNYYYEWRFCYDESLGSNININMHIYNQNYASRVYITDQEVVINPGTFSNVDDIKSYYGANNTRTEGAMNMLSPQGDLRQTYSKHTTSYDQDKIVGQHQQQIRDIQMHKGYVVFQEQNVRYNVHNTVDPQYDDFSAVYLGGNGLAFVGDFNKNYTEDYMYTGKLTTDYSGWNHGGAALSFWGNINHEEMIEHHFAFELGSGLSFDNWGNIHMMYSSVSWNVNDYRGINMLFLNQSNGDMLFGNVKGQTHVPGKGGNDFDNGSHHPIQFEGKNGHITLGNLWMSTFGCDGTANADITLNLVADGWFRFTKDIDAPNYHNHSMIEDKYAISKQDTNKAINAIQNTDFVQYHFKANDNRAGSLSKGVVIDKGNQYSIDNSLVDDDGSSYSLTGLVSTLGKVVQEQQKQISELMAKVACLEIKNK